MDKYARNVLKWYQSIVDGLKELMDENKLPEKQQAVVEQTYGYMLQTLKEQKRKPRSA